FGVEGEGYWSGMKARQEFSDLFSGEGRTAFAEVRNKYDFTVAGRFGVTYERAFIYGKAGWAWGKFDFSAGNTECCTVTYAEFGSSTLNGPLFGVGVEYALTNNVTVKGEYNYINYGLTTVNFAASRCFSGEGCDLLPFSQSYSAE